MNEGMHDQVIVEDPIKRVINIIVEEELVAPTPRLQVKEMRALTPHPFPSCADFQTYIIMGVNPKDNLFTLSFETSEDCKLPLPRDSYIHPPTSGPFRGLRTALLRAIYGARVLLEPSEQEKTAIVSVGIVLHNPDLPDLDWRAALRFAPLDLDLWSAGAENQQTLGRLPIPLRNLDNLAEALLTLYLPIAIWDIRLLKGEVITDVLRSSAREAGFDERAYRAWCNLLIRHNDTLPPGAKWAIERGLMEIPDTHEMSIVKVPFGGRLPSISSDV